MLKRLTNAAIAFAALVACYQGYVLVLLPFVEPAGAAEQVIEAIPREVLERPPESLKRYEPLLKAYFPLNHWCFEALPKIIENGQALIVFDRYEQSNDGVLRVPKCAVVFFPNGRDPAADPPRDAIILEPSDGATLHMDQTIGQKFGSMGRMQKGQLLGAVTVRSDMKEPGPQDDLLIETKDLYMTEEFIHSKESVSLDLGASHGRGKGLEIRFYKSEVAAGAAAGASLFGKLNSLEISREVAGVLAPGKTSLFGETTVAQPDNGGDKQGQLADDPVDIECKGPFHIDFESHVATFSQDVKVHQTRPDGTPDELLADMLTLYFAEVRQWGDDVTPTPNRDKPAATKIKLEPATIEAQGLPDAPVQLNAPSQDAVARGERLRIELIQRRVTLSGGDEDQVTLLYRGAEVHAPMVQYELPPKGLNQRLGVMNARGGGGRLRMAPDPTKPTEILEVRWTDSMQLIRSSRGQPLLRLDGRPKVSMLGRGTLWADQLELYLRETAAIAAPQDVTRGAGSQDGGALPSTISAERVVATGHVGIESAELSAQVNQLDLRIYDPADQGGAGTVDGASGSGSPTNGGVGGSTQPSLLDRNRSGLPSRTYNITGATLQLDAVKRQKQAAVTAIRVDGAVVFKETTPGAAGEAPLRILAEHLAVTDADTPQAKIEIRGGDATGSLPAGLAEIASRGTVLRAPALLVNRGTSQAWINAPGEVQLLMTRDVQGNTLTTPQPLHITWRDSMKLERDHITFLGNVHVQHPEGWLETSRLVAVLTQPVQFDGARTNVQTAELAQLECWEGAKAEFDQRDASGAIISHQFVKMESLVVNQVNGAIRGDGPGHIDSIHYSKGDGKWLIMPESVPDKGALPQPIEQEAPAGPPKLKHLSLDFVRGVEGNIHTPDVRVYGDVRTVYGPVNSWDERLKMSASGSPGPETFWITCDSLKVSDSPLARIQKSSPDGRRRSFGLVEILCETNVTIEGQHPQQGAFTLRGNRASFDQAKGLFVLQGDGAAQATIERQQYPGGPIDPQSANSFMYWQQTGAVKVIGFSQFDWKQFDAK